MLFGPDGRTLYTASCTPLFSLSSLISLSLFHFSLSFLSSLFDVHVVFLSYSENIFSLLLSPTLSLVHFPFSFHTSFLGSGFQYCACGLGVTECVSSHS